MVRREEKELTELLTKLYTIQEDVGARAKTTDEEKRDKAQNAAKMGKGRAAKKTGTRFIEVKSSIVDRLRKVHSLLEVEAKRNKGLMAVTDGNNPKDVIARQAEMREEIRQSEEEWKELNTLYKTEARKRNSKFTAEELEVQQTLVQRLGAEIEKVKNMQSRGYTKTTDDKDAITADMNAQAIVGLGTTNFNSGADSGSKWADAEGPGVEMTDSQALQLSQIQDRDKEFDKQIDQIGEGIKDLNEIAMMQNEEVQRQGVMLENVEQKIDDAQDHIQTVNERMKETLDEVRAADKICVDIMCIVLMIGLAAAMYHMIKQNS